MTLLPWQSKKYIQGHTALEHMADTSVNSIRGPALLLVNASQDSPQQSTLTGERFLHAYLNECHLGQTKEWYSEMQTNFLRDNAQWSNLFNLVLDTRKAHGGKSQKNNSMGDWFALSQLQDAPLPFSMLTSGGRRDPRIPVAPVAPRDIVRITSGSPRAGRYRDVFELLYTKHQSTHNGWQALIARMDFQDMTPNIWDVYVDLYPDDIQRLFNDKKTKDYEWTSILSNYANARHAPALNRTLVAMMLCKKADALYDSFSGHYYTTKSPLCNSHMSNALYEALGQAMNTRQVLNTPHLIHVLNAEPLHMEAELNYAISNKHDAITSYRIVKPEFMDQLNAQAREHLMVLLGENPLKYTILLEGLLQDPGEKITQREISVLLEAPYAKAMFVDALFKGSISSLTTRIANDSIEISAELLASDFQVPNTFERVMMQHLTPKVTCKAAVELMSISDSLGADKQMTRAMFQTAFEDTPQSNSFPIDEILGDFAVNSVH